MSESVVDIILKATNQTKRALQEPIEDLGDLKGALTGAMPLWGAMAAAAATASFELGKAALEAGDAAFLASQKVGMSVESYSALAFAAGEVAVPTETLETGLKKFSQAVEGAATGNKLMTTAFKELGVSVTDANGKVRPTTDIMNDVADAFQKLPDGAGKAAVAVQLFGRGGLGMIPMLNQGSAGLKEMTEKADSLGQVLSGQFAAQSHEFMVTVDDIHKGIQGWYNGLMADLLPGLQVLAGDMETAVAKGGVLYYIFQELATVVELLAKVIMTLYLSIRNGIEIVTQAIVEGVAAVIHLLAGNLSQAGDDIKELWTNIANSSQKTSDQLNATWSGVQVGPKLDVNGHKKDLEAVLAADVAAQAKEKDMKKAEDEADKIRHDNQMNYYKTAPLTEIQNAIMALQAKKQLNAQELKDLQALENDKLNMSKRINAAMGNDYKKMTKEQVAVALSALPSYQNMNAAQLADYTNLIKTQEQLDQEQSNAKKSILNEMTKFSRSSNSTMAEIGKQAAAAQATMDTYAAAAKALDSAPYPYNYVLAGITVAAGLAYVGQIEGISGFEDGGMVPGNSYSGDNAIVKANAGELILTRAQQSSLAGQLGNGGNSQGGQMTVYVGSQKLFDIITDGFKNGRLTVPKNAVRAV